MPASRAEASRFLNVDLDLRCADELAVLLAALAPRASVLNPEIVDFAVLELNEQPASLHDAIAGFHAAVTALAPAMRVLWDRCSLRRFDAGFQAGVCPDQSRFEMSPETIRMLADMGGTLVFTIYGAEALALRDGRWPITR